jgi:Xaa-Pro aminopeptidase
MKKTAGRGPVSRITFGPMQVDWEVRIDFEKMRKERLQRARDAMAKAGLDYLILVRAENCRYTTSIKRLYWPTIRLGGGPIVALPHKGDPVVWITDVDFAAKALVWLQGGQFKKAMDMDVENNVERFVKNLLEVFGSDIEKAQIGVDIWSPAMYNVLPKRLPKAKFINGQDVMLQARVTKTPEEIACMKMAYVISEAGMQAALDILKPGVRECELVGECFRKFWDLGSETSQCSQAVNSGPGTHPYRRFHTDRIVQAGETINMDFGACFNGYFGDFCRSFVCGTRPSKEQADLLRRGYDFQMEAFDAIRPGVSPAELCQKLKNNDLGHGIGISAFEPPHLRGGEEFIIQPGMTFSVTTPMNLVGPSGGGVHLEDEIVITESGCEVYSTFPYTGVND